MRGLIGKLSYANVVATLALFVALGGASYAAVSLPTNSVGAKQLRKNAVTAAKIKNGAVTGAKVKLSSLGTVPKAAEAQTLGGQTALQIAASSKLKCPAGMRLGGGACIEDAERPALELAQAMQVCGQAGLRLPSRGELIAYEMQYYTSFPPQDWVDSIYVEGVTFKGVNLKARGGSEPGVLIGVGNASLANPFRCATAPSN
ncbi:MAG TPA: hypothetical protein VMT37_13335 [Solirubrobacterales bacterium]|nr:hypothetical protein [Solirubrobacterales bacterium]